MRAGKLIALLAMILLRLLYLDSDAYPRLSWSSALLTDEGFYIHNARNLILFGVERTDDFNNMLLMPLLHVIQVGYFRCFGVGALQARGLTVLFSFLVLIVYYFGLRRAFGDRIAWFGLVLLGLDPVFLMYNRMALMDTPACLPLCFAFLAWSYRRDKSSTPVKSLLPTFLTGVCLGLAYSIRGLAIIVAVVPVALLAGHALQEKSWGNRAWFLRELGALIVGMAAVLSIYALLVWLPNRVEMAHANHFYLHAQLLPHSLNTFNRNVIRAISDPFRGILPFLLKHSPIYVIAALMIAFGVYKSRAMRVQHPILTMLKSDEVIFLIGWILIFLVFVTVVSYSPSRYYILFYAPLAALAAIVFDHLLSNPTPLLMWISWRKAVCSVMVALWAVSGLYWYTDWLGHLTYRQRDADRWLAEHLPPHSVVMGAVAPGLCLNNRFRCITMIPNLCNDDHPVERFKSYPRYIVMLDRTSNSGEDGLFDSILYTLSGRHKHPLQPDRWREAWWEDHYPDIVDPSLQIHAFEPILRPFFTIGVYEVPQGNDIFWKDSNEVARASK